MTGFLSRIAARAVGQAPVARPRVPSVFEGRGVPAEGGLEIVEAEVVAPRPARGETRRGEPSPRAAGPARPDIGDARKLPTADPPEPAPTAAPTRMREPEAPVPTAAVRDVRKLVTHTTEHVTHAEPLSAVAIGSELPVEARAPAAVAAVAPASRARQELGPRQAPAQAAVAQTTVAEPPAVRVHIGRLEVRANLQPAPPQPRRRAETVPSGPSLSEYLRGRRATS